MDNNLNQEVIEQKVDAPVEQVADALPTEQKEASSASNDNGFKFFKCCSASLKRFSVIVFIMNIFISLGLLGAVIVTVIVNLGTALLPVLALPLFTLFVILIIISRFVSALIYGFAEIVEKSEK